VIKIIIADDHAIVRHGLKQIIADQPDMQVIGEAENAGEALRLIQMKDAHVIVLDITMPGKSGLDLLPEIKQLRPMIKILILSMHAEEQFAVRALKSGASGYITKQSAPTELIKAIRKVQSGGKYISQSIAEQLAFFVSDDNAAPLHERLSDREFQVLRMIGAGKTLREIADELIISEKTVGTYRLRILEKMQMTRNAELIRYAVQNNLID
jgi:two-component system, NarL family, invasion response regulator UvrY